VGAIAMNLHGAPRTTADLDILADFRENMSALLVLHDTEDRLSGYDYHLTDEAILK